ncbi:DUF1491 family protein [Pseudochelatococcus sp. G4_1912]|uniref:DUF1491 family protein n=1 Tax=Pseudochelatococcus sp. G4_1912 TaxID=3114288 RepID=UPI0039C6219F
MRLKSGIWVAAYLRRCAIEGAFAVLRQRGAEDAGAIFVQIDKLDGTVALFGPAPQSLADEDTGVRLFTLIPLREPTAAAANIRLQREREFDSDLWIVDVEDREGRHFLDLAKE